MRGVNPWLSQPNRARTGDLRDKITATIWKNCPLFSRLPSDLVQVANLVQSSQPRNDRGLEKDPVIRPTVIRVGVDRGNIFVTLRPY